MKFLFWLLGLFALAVALTLAAHNPGYVLLVYPPYRIELSLSLFVVGLVSALVLAHLSLRLISAALNLPVYVRRFRSERALAQRRTALMDALGAFFEGRYAASEKAAARAIDLGENSGITPILAARAAHELQRFEQRDAYLEAAKGSTESETTMRLIAMAKFNLDQHQPLAALDTLKALREAGGRGHIGVLYLELKALRLAGNWDGVLDAVNQLERRESINATYAAQMRQQAWLEKIRTHAHNASELQTVWRSVPREFQLRTKIATVAASAFIQLGDCKVSHQIITDSLDLHWDGDLIKLYGDCLSGDVIVLIEQAERWLKLHIDDAGLLLALGKLCLHQRLWGKAQSYLEASVSIAPSRAAYTMLGQLAEKMQKPDEALSYLQKVVALASGMKDGERRVGSTD